MEAQSLTGAPSAVRHLHLLKLLLQIWPLLLWCGKETLK
jgi:hypothetical protein